MSQKDLEEPVKRNKFPPGKDRNANQEICITKGLIDCKTYLSDMNNTGYTTVEGLFKEYDGEKYYHLKALDMHRWFDQLMNYFTGALDVFKKTIIDEFTSIANIGDEKDVVNVEQMIGRFQSTRMCVTENMETKEKV